MQQEHELTVLVAKAKGDMLEADKLIRDYIPFIKATASKVIRRICTEQDDEYSIAMIAFHEAIQSYNSGRGSFLKLAELTIRSRIIDYLRKESKHSGNISIYEEDEDERPMHESLHDGRDAYEESASLDATKQEIAELAAQLGSFGVSFTDIAENSPKQDRTLDTCRKVIVYAVENKSILDELLETKKLPLAKLCEGVGAERKTLERHRKYLLAMLLIQTNGYEIIRGHIKHVINGKGGEAK